MVIGIRQLDLHFPAPQSLKEKRMILKSLMTRIRQQYNVAIAELDGMNLWQKSTLAVVTVGSEKKFVNQVLDRALEIIKNDREVEVMKESLEIV